MHINKPHWDMISKHWWYHADKSWCCLWKRHKTNKLNYTPLFWPMHVLYQNSTKLAKYPNIHYNTGQRYSGWSFLMFHTWCTCRCICIF